jgi:hypothetical protein
MRIRRPLLALALMSALLPLSVHSAHAVVSGVQVDLGTMLSPPANLSTSGDFATDTFSDPWDFSNAEDIIPINGVGIGVAAPVQDPVRLASGQLTVTTQNATEIRLLMKWPAVLPWGRDGWAHPIDAS